ncbi:hypothetical protein TorRG33x02_065860 [Trema orientale]|uniref:Uncharacterized protein n=1 Tax=Trema orientale TaxID=63057 RepID=A0A2P5FIT0_TREOI|nr:hypothetical protein TorRG33x02_065860 [Trema orientale]
MLFKALSQSLSKRKHEIKQSKEPLRIQGSKVALKLLPSSEIDYKKVEKLTIESCDNLETNSASAPTPTAAEEGVGKTDSVAEQPQFTDKVVFLNLEELKLWRTGGNIEKLVLGKNIVVGHSHRLRKLTLFEFPMLMHLFEEPEDFQIFQNLETLWGMWQTEELVHVILGVLSKSVTS